MIQQVASSEQALIKTNMKPIQNHQRKTVLLLKTYTLEFEFDRHLKHMDSCQGMQSGLFVIPVGEFGTLEIFMHNNCLVKPDFSLFLQLQTSKLDRIWTEYDHISSLTNHQSTLLRFWLIYKA